MRAGIRVATLGVAVTIAAATAGVARAVYTSPTLTLTQSGARATIAVQQSQADDSTHKAVIYAPARLALTLSQPPGSVLGSVTAQVTALALGGALLPLTGEIRVASQGAVTAAQATACTGAATHAATWLMVLTAAGQTLNMPMYVDPAAGTETAFSSGKIQVCLPPPDVPQDRGGATLGAKLINATFTLTGVFAPGTGTWRTVWTPYFAGNGQVNTAGSVESRADVATGAVTAQARKTGRRKLGARVTGTVRQGAEGAAGTPVTIFGGQTRSSLRRLGTVRAGASGAFAYTRSTGGLSYFRASAAALPRRSETGCTAPGPLPVSCVNATVSGFTAVSGVVRAR